MSPSPCKVKRHAPVGIELPTGPITATVDLDFDPRSPLDVAATFRVDGNPDVTWLISRDLIAVGCASFGDTGVGFVTIRRNATVVWFHLDSPEGKAAVHVERAHLVAFLAACEMSCPIGGQAEHDAVDAAAEAVITASRAWVDTTIARILAEVTP